METSFEMNTCNEITLYDVMLDMLCAKLIYQSVLQNTPKYAD